MSKDLLKRYGYEDMFQFRNWRWFKELSGGPISDLGAHQIDIFNWYLGTYPKSVMASGGADYYPNREWYDNVMVIYEYETQAGPVRAFYQTLTTTSAGGGYWEYFMGDEGSIKMSENPSICKVFREERAPDWDKWIGLNYLRKGEAPPPPAKDAKVDVRETAPLASFDIPITADKPPHQPHLENFFDAVRGKGKLNADGEHSYKSEVGIFRVNEAVGARKTLEFAPSDFEV
jgi:predicted dehydrogenase